MGDGDLLIPGQTIDLSTMAAVMNERSFQALLAGKSSNTTIPYMLRAKELIIRGLLTRGSDARSLNDNQELIGGTYRTATGISQGRVFLVNGAMATLLWTGPDKEFRAAWMRIRDEHAGVVPYRLYGRAASTLRRGTIMTNPAVKPPKAPICRNAARINSRGAKSSRLSLRPRHEIDFILHAYRALFPGPTDPRVRKHLDLDRDRPWSLLTTDFHQADCAVLASFHLEREQIQLEGVPPREAGQLLRELHRKHPIVGGSLGISPWTDEILLHTFRPGSKRVWAVIGHDWYPIVPECAVKNGRIREGNGFLIEARSPQWRYPLYEENPCIRNASDYRSALPNRLPSDVCLLFLNLVPDLRPCNVKAEGRFPFEDSGLSGYPECVKGIVELLSSLSGEIELSGVMCWGTYVRDSISQFSGVESERLKKGLHLRVGGSNPFVLACLHPAARAKDFPQGRKDYYDRCWSLIASNGDRERQPSS